MWKVVLILAAGVAGQPTLQQQIDVLLRSDQRLMEEVQQLRAILNGQMTSDLQALARKTEWNRDAIVKVATVTQGEILALLAKVNSQNQELGEVKSVAESVLPQENRKIDVAAGASQQAESAAHAAEQETQATAARETAKLKEVAEWLQAEFRREDAQLESMMRATESEAHGTAKATRDLLKEEDAQLERQINKSRRKIANVTNMVQKILPEEQMDFQQRLGDMGQKLEAVALAFEDAHRRTQNELQLHSNQLMLLQNRLEKASGRYESVNETLDGVVMAQRVNFFLILPSLIIGMVGFFATQWYGECARRAVASSSATSPLREPLLAASTQADSEISFSVVTPHAALQTQVHQFLPKSTFSSTDGPVAAEALRPKALIRSAVGTSLEVQSVTFRHVSECAVVELSLGEALPTTTVIASHRVMVTGPSGQCDKVVSASELRVGDTIALAGADAEVSGACRRLISHMTIIEVEFSPDEPVGTLLDVGEHFYANAIEPQFNFHVV